MTKAKAIGAVRDAVTKVADDRSGPLDKYRNRKPEQYDQAEWDQLIDDLNKEYGTSKKKDKSGIGGGAFTGTRTSQLERMELEDVVAAGQKSGTLKTDSHRQAKRDAAREIAGSARNLTNSENARLAGVDLETQNANTRDAEALAALKGEKDKASAGFHQSAADVRTHANEANKKQDDLVAGLGKDYSALNLQDQNALADYLSATDPMMAEIFARGSDPADLQRQLDAYGEQKGALDKYKELSDPAVTGKERYLSELARREFEASDKSNREAVSEQLANRGLRSGGQQIAMQQATQQGLSQDRLLKELGIQAGAVDRSMKAMEGYSTSAGRLGLQSDAIRGANDSQRQFEDTFKVQEAERRSGLAGSRKTASDTTTGTVGGRDKEYFDAGKGAAADSYTRDTQADKAAWDATGKDYGMAGDYYAADTGTGATRVARATDGANLASRLGIGAHDRLGNALSVGLNEQTDEEEYDLAF